MAKDAKYGLGRGTVKGAGEHNKEDKSFGKPKNSGLKPLAGRMDRTPSEREKELGTAAPKFFMNKRGRGRWGATEGGEACKP